MNTHIIIFSLINCPHCTVLKKKLEQNNIDYRELDINEHREVWRQVVDQTGFSLVPTVFIRKEGSDDGPVFIPGRDFKQPQDLLEKLKEYL